MDTHTPKKRDKDGKWRIIWIPTELSTWVSHTKKKTTAAERRLSKCAQYKLMQCVCVCGVYCNFLAICALKSSIHVLNCGCIASSLENNVEWNGISVILISKQINQFELELQKPITRRKEIHRHSRKQRANIILNILFLFLRCFSRRFCYCLAPFVDNKSKTLCTIALWHRNRFLFQAHFTCTRANNTLYQIYTAKNHFQSQRNCVWCFVIWAYFFSYVYFSS